MGSCPFRNNINCSHNFCCERPPVQPLEGVFKFPESPHRFSASCPASLLSAPLDRCQLDPVPQGCQSHTWGPAHLSSRCRQCGWWLTEVMSCSRLREGFPPEIQLACAESKTTRTPTNPTQHHPHVAPRRQGQQSAWWISALTRFSSSGPIRKILLRVVFSFFNKAKFSLCLTVGSSGWCTLV